MSTTYWFKVVVAAFCAFGITGSAYATLVQVIYVNGIENNTKQDALISVKRIQTILDLSANHLDAKRNYHVQLIYNPDGFTSAGLGAAGCNQACQLLLLRDDKKELFIQKTSEEHFVYDFPNIIAPFNASSTIDQTAALRIKACCVDTLLPGGNFLESSGLVTTDSIAPNGAVIANIVQTLKSNGQSIVVAHSQGNLLVNLAYAQLASEIGQLVRKVVRVVNVANTTRFSISGLNITHANDAALFSVASRLPLGDVSLETLPRQGAWTRTTDFCFNSACNFTLAAPTFAGASTPGFLDHAFVETYLSEVNLPNVAVEQGVAFTTNKTRFVDRFEDFIYAAAGSLAAENSTPLKLLLTTQDEITALASDGAFLYFGTVNGKLFRMFKNGSALQQIATVPGFIDAVVFDAGNIYFDGNPQNSQGGSIYVMPKDLSSTPTVLIARVTKLLGLTGSTLYYWDGDGSIKSQLTSGSVPNLLLPPLYITDFAVDGLSIYLDQYQGDTLVRLDTVTKVVTVLLPQEFGRDPIVFDASNVYTGRSTLMRMPKIQDGLAFPLVTTTAGNVLAPLFSDGTTLYYREGSSTVAGTDVLKSMPAYGGASTPLATGLAIKYLVGDATALYWVDSIIGGTAISSIGR